MGKRRSRRIDARKRAQTLHEETRAAQRAADTAKRRAQQAERRMVDSRAQIANGHLPTSDPLIETIYRSVQERMARDIAYSLIEEDSDLAADMRHMILLAARCIGRDPALWQITTEARFAPGFIEFLRDEMTHDLRLNVSLPPVQINSITDRHSLLL